MVPFRRLACTLPLAALIAGAPITLALVVWALPSRAQWNALAPLAADGFQTDTIDSRVAAPETAAVVQPSAPIVPQPRPPAPPRTDGPEQVTVSQSPIPTFSPDSLRATERALMLYRDIASRGGWPRVPPPPAGTTLALGATGPAVTVLRQRLAASGDLAPEAAGDGAFDMELEEALRRFQLRHGLTTTGAVGPMTLKALNVPAAERVRQLEASLARLAERDFVFAQRYVAVNLAAAAVEAVDGGQVARRFPAVVGRPENASPELVARITAVNLNPTWTAPLSIVKKEILPKLARDPAYLARANMRLIDGSGREIDPRTVNPNGPVNFSVRQDSGASNSLGFLRIDMPNSYSVYMHDTPRRDLFRSDYRFHSHGCVRVGNVRDLAAWLLTDTPGWERKQIDAAIATGRRTDIRLTNAMPVVWIYLTGWGTADGTAHFREDVYDLDDKRRLDPSMLVAARRPDATGAAGFALQSAARPLELKPSANRLDDL
ncbi:L,D-transpeptidase family protein [Blastochloris sulfoviridis]|uniref:L,D-transpeptidase family protein n=1 Tax=Blastochloris sulfoviridis TaxID=50712 RepID=A0A5M6HN53_9HYPH|nr:L,D-transpeptidase family protein [Blastochloris sulfoviridis]KAA5597283.1 L,D-transpeptidase family protein [Blastochloris sulfoviridis]